MNDQLAPSLDLLSLTEYSNMADCRHVLGALLAEVFNVFNEDCIEEDEEFAVLYSVNEEQQRNPRVCIENYVETVIPLYTMSDFKSHFRMEKSTFETVLGIISQDISVSGRGRPTIAIEKQLLSSIWLLSNLETFRSVCDRFDMCKSGLYYSLNRIAEVLSHQAPNIIYWPHSNWAEEEQKFRTKSGFPGVIGAIDGTHIPIKAPHVNPEAYNNRKNFYSIILQAVCASDLTFSHIFCSFPGSVHDARVYRNSEVAQIMCGNHYYFPDHTHIIGDAAYPLQTNLMVPYKNNGHLGERQLNFNKKLSRTRMCIERAFGLLKGRFRRLKYFDVERVERLPLYVLVCCLLHNVCIRARDFSDEDVIEKEDILDDGDDNDDLTARNKRDYLSGIL